MKEARVLTLQPGVIFTLADKQVVFNTTTMDITNGVVFTVRLSHNDVLLQKIRDRVVFHWTISQS
ncbi:hypothetical protein D3C81_1893600 [compost metagenome]